MFYFSLPILFKDIRLISPEEFFLIMVASLVLLFLAAPPLKSSPVTQDNENYLLNAWLGNIGLTKVFWPFFLLFNAILFSIDSLAKAGKLTVSSWDDIHFVLILPFIWWLTSVWRCSSLTSTRMWSALARLTTLLVIAEYALKLLIRIDYPRLFFNCEDLLVNYGSCF